MIPLLLKILEKYGLGAANFVLLAFVSWKLFTNHFRHLTQQINKIDKTLTSVKENVGELAERVSHLEGQID